MFKSVYVLMWMRSVARSPPGFKFETSALIFFFQTQSTIVIRLPSLMDSWLGRLNGPATRLILIAIASSSLTALTILSLQSLRREQTLSSIKKEASSIPPTEIHRLNSIGAKELTQPSFKDTQIANRAKRGEYDEELILEQLARNRAFFGDEGLSRIRKAFVIVVGAGGVGSWAATMLARSGVGILHPIEHWIDGCRTNTSD
jgi:tRNA threonylcarbamoyladenosine dehydratase